MNPVVNRPVRIALVQVIGRIWDPGAGTCAYTYELSDSDLKAIGDLTRENVEQWLAKNAGDFSKVEDFRAVVGADQIPWKTRRSRRTFAVCMGG